MSDHTTAPRAEQTVEHPLIGSPSARYVFAVTRISLGWVFLWAFLDKLLGLGLSTPTENSWLNGGSPTAGFLSNAVSGPFEGAFGSLAGVFWADPLFMVGLLGIGAALVLGIGERIAAASGALMMILMWAAVLPLDNNPFMDDHIVYALVLVGLALVRSGDTLGLGRWWGSTPLVQRVPALR